MKKARGNMFELVATPLGWVRLERLRKIATRREVGAT